MLIVNRCSKPPWGLERQVRRSLRWIDQSHLEGLDSIRIESEMPDRPDRVVPEIEWAKQVRAISQTACVNGWYAEGSGSTPPYIMLYARPIYRPIPMFFWWSAVPTLRIVSTLAHEVAHHLVAKRGYVFDQGEDLTDEESLANRYSASVLQKTTARFSYRLGQSCLKEIAAWYYNFAILDWRQKNYKAAAEGFYNAWNLNPEHQEANYWHWRAKEMSSFESK